MYRISERVACKFELPIDQVESYLDTVFNEKIIELIDIDAEEGTYNFRFGPIARYDSCTQKAKYFNCYFA